MVGISCEVADYSQEGTPGLTIAVQACIMSKRSLSVIGNVKLETVLLYCQIMAAVYEGNKIQVILFYQVILHTNITSNLAFFDAQLPQYTAT